VFDGEYCRPGLPKRFLAFVVYIHHRTQQPKLHDR